MAYVVSAMLVVVLGMYFLVAAFHPPLQPLAFVAGFGSVVPFMWLVKAAGEHNAQIERVYRADVVALVCLVVAVAAHALRDA